MILRQTFDMSGSMRLLKAYRSSFPRATRRPSQKSITLRRAFPQKSYSRQRSNPRHAFRQITATLKSFSSSLQNFHKWQNNKTPFDKNGVLYCVFDIYNMVYAKYVWEVAFIEIMRFADIVRFLRRRTFCIYALPSQFLLCNLLYKPNK